MISNQNIVWFEGMALDPHHFQQVDRYRQMALNFRMSAISHYEWGFIDCAIDKEALANGRFSLQRCSGVMPDGLHFLIPDNDPIPSSRDIKQAFPPTEEKLVVYLAVPVERYESKNCALESSGSSDNVRFISRNITLRDANTGSDEREITIKVPQFKLLFSNETLEDYTHLPLAEIVRTADGRFSLNDKFIPPCLTCLASFRLREITNDLLEHLIGKRAALLEQGLVPISVKFEISPADVNLYLFFHTINSFIPLLNHNHDVPHCHPERLFSLLLTFAGQLTTFSLQPEVHPGHLPRYDHRNLSLCFNQLNETIHELMGQIKHEKNYIPIPLEKHGDTLFIGRIADPALLSEAQFFLILSGGELDESKTIIELPRMIKIASVEKLQELERFALSGLKVKHTEELPGGLPLQPDSHYFNIEKADSLWEDICSSGTIALRIPQSYIGINLELIAIKVSQ
ncbi:type VI secretion system baseplate subunit TssK [candidate division CSSED10-310 bacterium]|uniref:Type VI secretion system baseplate subunit TssK n=1 Tax=candidate division CSSED10-310 bacterium TaxID=2855610 RepID=A0ABV6Z4S7_UNCC1